MANMDGTLRKPNKSKLPKELEMDVLATKTLSNAVESDHCEYIIDLATCPNSNGNERLHEDICTSI